MSGHIPWAWVKFRKGNVQKGLETEEICPGVTVVEHAESLAMFELHDLDSDLWPAAVAERTIEIKERLMTPFFGQEETINELTES